MHFNMEVIQDFRNANRGLGWVSLQSLESIVMEVMSVPPTCINLNIIDAVLFCSVYI